MQKKPEWYFDINPRGTVPAIEKNGDILYESDITSYYVDEIYGGKKLTTTDPLKRAYERIILGYFIEVSLMNMQYYRINPTARNAGGMGTITPRFFLNLAFCYIYH